MIVSLDSKIETTNGTFSASELVAREDLKEFKLHAQKRILDSIQIIGKDYSILTPLSLQRVGKGKCVKISTHYGFECIVPEKTAVNIDLNDSKPASLLKSGDSILLSGNYSDVTSMVPMIVDQEYNEDGFILINEVIAEIAGLAFVFGDMADNEIFITKIPVGLLSDISRKYLFGKSVVFNILSAERETVSIRIKNKNLIDILLTLGVMKKDKFPEFLWKSPRSVGYAFLKSYIINKLSVDSIHSMHISLLKELQEYLFIRFGIIGKFDRKLNFSASFFDTFKNVVAEKMTLSDINTDITHSLVTENGVVYYLKDFITSVEVIDRELFDISFEEENPSISLGSVL